MKTLCTLALSLVFMACTNDKLPRYGAINSLRVLALEADVPEVNYDTGVFTPSTVSITPWISDLYGSGRALEYSSYWCLDPGVGQGAVPTCEGNPTKVTLSSSTAVSTSATFLSPNYTGALAPFSVDLSQGGATVQAVIAQKFNALSAAAQFNGYSILVFFELQPVGSSDSKITSFRRIVFSSSAKTSKNQNPAGNEVRLGSSEITDLPSVEAKLVSYLPGASTESYLFYDSQNSVATLTENLDSTWFLTAPTDLSCARKKECSTDGVFQLTRSDPGQENTFYPPQVSVPTTRGRVLVLVTRDNRGGLAVKRYCSGICP